MMVVLEDIFLTLVMLLLVVVTEVVIDICYNSECHCLLMLSMKEEHQDSKAMYQGNQHFVSLFLCFFDNKRTS